MGNPIVVSSTTGFANTITAGAHSLTADEPEHVGGADTGMSPYELLLAALGACTSITLRMYANRKGWPLEAVEVRLEHEKIHAKDCEQCETERGRLDRIVRVIDLQGPLDDEQRARLMEIADKCPVHKTLKSEIHITSSLAASGVALGSDDP